MVTIEQLKKFRDQSNEMFEISIKQRWIVNLLNGIASGNDKLLVKGYDVFQKREHYYDSTNSELVEKCLSDMVRDGYKVIEETREYVINNNERVKKKVKYLTF